MYEHIYFSLSMAYKHISIRLLIFHSKWYLHFYQAYINLRICKRSNPSYHRIYFDLTRHQIIDKIKFYYGKLHKPTTILCMVSQYPNMGWSTFHLFHIIFVGINTIHLQLHDKCQRDHEVTKQWQVLNFVIRFDFLLQRKVLQRH